MKHITFAKYTLAAVASLGLAAATVEAREPKTRTKHGTWSASGGGSGTAVKTTTRSKGLRTTEGSATNAKGETATRSTRLEKNGDGTASYESNSAGFKGRQRSAEGTVSKTETGRVNEGTYTNAQGGQGTYVRNVDKTDTGHTATTSVTNDKGKTATSITDVSRDGDTVTATQTQTGPNGKTRTRTGTATRNK